MTRLVVLAGTTKFPAGVLPWPAWAAMRTGPVLSDDERHPHRLALESAGVRFEVLDPDDAAGIRRRLTDGDGAVWLASAARPDGPAGAFTEKEIVHVSLPGAQLLDVVATMDRLRSPGGCPWDAEQTHQSLAPYLLEEAYEAYDAIESGDGAALREELGDVLLQVVFHARLAEEEPGTQRWDIDDVAAGLVAKLVRRHPHVFGDVVARDAGEVAANWDVIKAAEKGRASVTEGVPTALPALVLAETLQRKAAELGMPADLLEDDDALWSAVVACRAEGIDAEADLRTRAKRFRDRLAAVELAAGAEGRNPREFSADEWRARWQQLAESRR